MYLSSAITEVKPMQGFNMFEDFGFTPSPHGPCKSIRITAEVRRLDEQAREDRLPADWRAFKATLSMSNLRTIKPKTVNQFQIPETKYYAVAKAKRTRTSSGRKCACGAKIGGPTKQCFGCYNTRRKEEADRKNEERKARGERVYYRGTMVRVQCEMCPNMLRAGRVGVCHRCKWQTKLRKECAPVAAVKKGRLR